MDDLEARLREALLRLEDLAQRIKALEEKAGQLLQIATQLRQDPATR